MTEKGPGFDSYTRDELRVFIMEEVSRQIAPIASGLGSLQMAMARIEAWKDSLFGNGSSMKPGYLEKAREEDKESLIEIKKSLNELQADKFRAEGAQEATQKQEALSEQKKVDSINTKNLYVQVALAIIAICAFVVTACGLYIAYKEFEKPGRIGIFSLDTGKSERASYTAGVQQ
jgi:hypothetical protein